MKNLKIYKLKNINELIDVNKKVINYKNISSKNFNNNDFYITNNKNLNNIKYLFSISFLSLYTTDLNSVISYLPDLPVPETPSGFHKLV